MKATSLAHEGYFVVLLSFSGQQYIIFVLTINKAAYYSVDTIFLPAQQTQPANSVCIYTSSQNVS